MVPLASAFRMMSGTTEPKILCSFAGGCGFFHAEFSLVNCFFCWTRHIILWSKTIFFSTFRESWDSQAIGYAMSALGSVAIDDLVLRIQKRYLLFVSRSSCDLIVLKGEDLLILSWTFTTRYSTY